MIQLFAEIWGDQLPDRSHPLRIYVYASLGGVVAVGLLVWALTGVGNWLARMQWQPEVVALQREVFDRSKFAIAHEGWERDHWDQREELTRRGESEALKSAGMKTAERGVSQIEELLEVKPRGDLAARVSALQPFFSK